MNTKETTGASKDLFTGDKLDRMFAAQRTLMDKYKPVSESHFSRIFKQGVLFSEESWKGGDFNLHTKEGNLLVKDMIQSAIQELAEAVQVMKAWKPWKTEDLPCDVDHWKEEMIDAWHFFMEALILAGVTPEELFELYFKKKEVNDFRLESKY